jgi:hypothetical protein
VVVVSPDAHQLLSWLPVSPGAPNERTMTLQHALQTPFREGDQGRLLLVGLVQELSEHDQNRVTYAGVRLTAVQANVSGTNEATVYYLADAQLPKTPGTYPLVVTTTATESGRSSVHAMELRNVAQEPPTVTPLGSSACKPAGVVEFNFDVQEPTFLYFLASFSGSGGFGAAGVDALVWSEEGVSAAQGAAAIRVTETLGTIELSRESCFGSTGAAAGWRPLGVLTTL